MNDIFSYTSDKLPKRSKFQVFLNMDLQEQDYKTKTIKESEEKTKDLIERLGKVDIVNDVRESLRLLRTILLEYPCPENQELDKEVFNFMVRIEKHFRNFNTYVEEFNDDGNGKTDTGSP